MRIEKALAWLGTGASILGAFMVASGFYFLGYIPFLVGSASWMIVARARKDNPLLLLNAVFFSANILGIVKHF